MSSRFRFLLHAWFTIFSSQSAGRREGSIVAIPSEIAIHGPVDNHEKEGFGEEGYHDGVTVCVSGA